MKWTELLSRIPRKDFIVKFNRSSGPGGQNVNKVNSKATIRLPREKLVTAEWISSELKDQLLKPKFVYATKRGDLVVSSELTRSQPSNLDDCFEKLAKEITAKAFKPADPSEEAQGRWKRLNKIADQKRKDFKIRHASKKQDRRV